MIYRLVSFVRKVSSKGNHYARLVVVDLNGNVCERFVYDPTLSRIESFGFNFGDYIKIECNLDGIVSVDSYEG